MRAARAGSTFTVRASDSTWTGASVAIAEPALRVISVASRDEFTAPFAAIRATTLEAVLVLTLGVAIAFVGFLWHGTRPLAQLTLAADQVAHGNLEPALPGESRTEVGRLTHAFAYMIERVRGMLQEVERSRQMAAIGEFASQISHEIRNPLTSIKLNLQKLQRGTQRGLVAPELARPLEISLGEIERLDAVVHAVLRLGRARALTRTLCEPSQVVARAIAATRAQLESRRVVVHAEEIDQHAPILADEALFESVIVNLLLNAADAMPNGGAVRVSITRPDERVCVRVEDDGPGIPRELRNQIFAPFYTTKPNGTGIGLSLAQRTIEEHRGTIAVVDPRIGRGAAFLIELPLAEEDAAS
jgi:signal transduction histidine kinase